MPALLGPSNSRSQDHSNLSIFGRGKHSRALNAPRKSIADESEAKHEQKTIEEREIKNRDTDWNT